MKEKVEKYAFVGTSCTGKTTLLREIKRLFADDSGVVFVEEAARGYFQKNKVDDRFGAEAQSEIQRQALESEKEAHRKGARLIFSDRSVIDAVIYLRAMADFENARQLLERVEFWLPTYNKFLLLDPIDIPYATDKVRQESEEERQKFHQEFVRFFTELGLPYELLSGTLDERVKRVMEILEGK